MKAAEMQRERAVANTIEMKLEVVVIPVSDVDRAKRFYSDLGWRLDIFHHASAEGLVSGPNPQRKSYASYASFSDPDGNGWVFQEVTVRLTGHIEEGDTSFTTELTNAVRRAEAGKRRCDGTGDRVDGVALRSVRAVGGGGA
jgi:catechol 2,3-dioxygenase-like lactoylglutathione lyase family enzyme